MNHLSRLISLTFIIATICSCGGSSSANEEKEYIVKYHKACNEYNFEEANNIVAEMQNSENCDQKEIEAAKEYIFQKEALYLVSVGDVQSNSRILFLLKEENNLSNFGEVVNSIIDLGVELDNKDLVTKMTKVYAKENRFSRKLMNYLKVNNDSLCNDYVKSYCSGNFYYNKDILDYLAEHNQADFYVAYAKNGSFDSELMDYLKDYNDALCYDYVKSYCNESQHLDKSILDYFADRHQVDFYKMYKNRTDLTEYEQNTIASLHQKCFNEILINSALSDSKLEGEPLPAGIFKAQDTYIDDKYEDFSRSLHAHNEKCVALLECAIRNHNLPLANMAIQKFKKNMHITDQGVYSTKSERVKVERDYDQSGLMGKAASKLFGDTYTTTETVTYEKNKFLITWDWDDKNAAKKMLSDSQANGAFN